MNSVREQVVNGAALLDKITDTPWRNEIDTSILDMGSHSDCLLGQLYGSYINGRRIILNAFPKINLYAAGFDSSLANCESLNRAWVEHIKETR